MTGSTVFKTHDNQRLSALLLILIVMYITVTMADSREVLTFYQPTSIADNAQLHIQGHNHSTEQRILVIRIDDRKNPAFAERVNLERTLPAGAFNLQLSLAGLHSPSRRKLQLEELHQIIVFAGDDSDDLQIETLAIHHPEALPDGVFAWDLGPADSALWPGFTPLTPDSTLLHGKQLIQAVDRGSQKQANEGLTTDGIRGIKELRLPLPNGRWFITLWLRDPGEWEHLPHPLNRRIMANGREVWAQQYTAKDWIEQVYLAGGLHEATLKDDAWSLFGERANSRISFMADVSNNELRLAFSGEQPDASFVSAILAESGKNNKHRDRVEAERAVWWRNNWRIENWPQPPAGKTALIALQKNVITATDTTANMRFDIIINKPSAKLVIHVDAPALNKVRLKTDLRWGQWRLKRSSMSATSLTASNSYLRGDSVIKKNLNGQPRRIHLSVEVPKSTPAGRYKGRLSVFDGTQTYEKSFIITVPYVTLPPVDRPIGVYLERPIHFDWFTENHLLSTKAMICDMTFLRKLGMSGIAPPLTTPVSDEETERFIEDIRITTKAGFLSPILAYSPFKRLERTLGIEGALSRISFVEKRLTNDNLPLPVWATADEPSNLGQKNPVDKIRRYASTFTPSTLLGGQLNNANDESLLDSFDVILINQGYDINEDKITSIKNRGITPWLYNIDNHRAAAGFYLWRIKAQGYLQWHARMPTADPFDPTDGREDDAQFLLPMTQTCPAIHDVDAKIFDLSEGITDLRWLLWLENQAKKDPKANKLLVRLHDEVPTTWYEMARLSTHQLIDWRLAITDLMQGYDPARKGLITN